MKELAVLLSLMIASSAEECQLYVMPWSDCVEVELKSDVLLDNVRTVMKEMNVSAHSFSFASASMLSLECSTRETRDPAL